MVSTPPFFSCLQFFAAMIVVINLSMTLSGATRNIFVKEFLEFAGIMFVCAKKCVSNSMTTGTVL